MESQLLTLYPQPENYENLLIDDILLSITAVVMLYALYRYAKIYMALIKEDRATPFYDAIAKGAEALRSETDESWYFFKTTA